VFDSPSLFEEDRWHRERARKQAGTLNVGESQLCPDLPIICDGSVSMQSTFVMSV